MTNDKIRRRLEITTPKGSVFTFPLEPVDKENADAITEQQDCVTVLSRILDGRYTARIT